jgi:hypothetical protein
LPANLQTGERFGAHDARRIGLVHEVVPLADLENAGAKVVEQLLANGPEALAETKALAMESSFGGMSVEDGAYARLVRMHAAKRQTFEASEGLASFAKNVRPTGWPAKYSIRAGRCGALTQPATFCVQDHLWSDLDEEGIAARHAGPETGRDQAASIIMSRAALSTMTGVSKY